MNVKRINNAIDCMKKNHITQMIISDSIAIFYLTGVRVFSGERLMVLYLNVNGEIKFLLNELIPIKENIGFPIVQYNDNQDAIEILNEFIEQGKNIGIDKSWPSRFLLKLQKLNPNSEYINGSPIIDTLRTIKDEEEKNRMRASSKINDFVMEKVIEALQVGKSEKDIAAITKQLYLTYGCSGVSFPPIIAFASGAANPHHFPQDILGKEGDCVVIDIGGMKDYYASDMTRTVFLGKVSERQKEIYNIVLEANLRGIAAAKPGNRMCDVDFAARNYIEQKGYGQYFTHRTGHSIGLEVHETGDVSALNTEIIREGQCFSIEPGIYLPDENIGIRIEDLVLITENGCEVLNNFSKEIIVV